MVRVLLVADTHLGFDEPLHPRVARRRRGPDFMANFERALEPALHGEVDFVVHGGDVFFRSKIPASLVERAFRPLAAVGAAGVPVLVVPGNHERSQIPYPLLAVHKNVHIFDRPRTFVIGEVAFSGFPFAPNVRRSFPALLRETGHERVQAKLRILCMHQAVEGARVGTPEFLFARQPDVIRARDLPRGFDAFLSGHIHRGQKLTRALDGTPLPAPFFYPGSVERTSFAERFETKGFLILRFEAGSVTHDWRPLPTQPMLEMPPLVASAAASVSHALHPGGDP
jgi:exonuclease SbcD